MNEESKKINEIYKETSEATNFDNVISAKKEKKEKYIVLYSKPQGFFVSFSTKEFDTKKEIEEFINESGKTVIRIYKGRPVNYKMED